MHTKIIELFSQKPFTSTGVLVIIYLTNGNNTEIKNMTTENTKPNVKVVNGISIPNISFKPAIGESCYVPFPTSKILYGHHIYHSGNESDGHLRDSGLCYPFTDEGRAAAILHAKAMLKYF